MIEKLFKMVEEAHAGMCIMLEYYHVTDYVISIYKSPAFIEENSPLIRTEGSLDASVVEAYFMLDYYLSLSKDERGKIVSLDRKIVRKERQ